MPRSDEEGPLNSSAFASENQQGGIGPVTVAGSRSRDDRSSISGSSRSRDSSLSRVSRVDTDATSITMDDHDGKNGLPTPSGGFTSSRRGSASLQPTVTEIVDDAASVRDPEHRPVATDQAHDQAHDQLDHVDPMPMSDAEVRDDLRKQFHMPDASDETMSQVQWFQDQISNLNTRIRSLTASQNERESSGIAGQITGWIGNNPAAATLTAIALAAAGKKAYDYWNSGSDAVQDRPADQNQHTPVAAMKEAMGTVKTTASTMARDGVQAIRNEVQFRGTPAIAEYAPSAASSGVIRTSHWRMPVKFKISRSNDVPIRTRDKLHKAFGNVVVRKADKVRLGDALGAARVHSTGGLDPKTIENFGKAVTQTFHVVENLKNEIEAQRKAGGLNGRARRIEPLSDNSKKALQSLGIHETELDKIDLNKLQTFLNYSHPHGQVYSLTKDSLGENMEGVPSKIRGTGGDGSRSYGSVGATDFKRASVATVKLEQSLLTSESKPAEAIDALMKAYAQRLGNDSLFKKDYVRTEDYKAGRATPTVSDASHDGFTRKLIDGATDLAGKVFDAGHEAFQKESSWRDGAIAMVDATKDSARERVSTSVKEVTSAEIKDGAKAGFMRGLDALTRSSGRGGERERGAAVR